MAELEQVNPWNRPEDALPKSGERVIIYLQGFDSSTYRPQFATWNSHSKVFQNAGNTKFKPEFVNWWMPVTALPPVPKEPESLYMKIKANYKFELPVVPE